FALTMVGCADSGADFCSTGVGSRPGDLTWGITHYRRVASFTWVGRIPNPLVAPPGCNHSTPARPRPGQGWMGNPSAPLGQCRSARCCPVAD
ncbi:MAG: hypothetical protein ABGY05_08600, partial [Pseudomonadota bacterium]